jgi:preprotein translocase subunit SecF
MKPFREIIKNARFDFIGMRNKAFAFSAILLILGCVGFTMISMGKANLSTDFTGGTSLHLRFKEMVSVGELRNSLANSGMHDVQIQETGGAKEYFVRTKLTDTEKEKVQDRIYHILSNKLPGNRFEVLESNVVGAAVGKTLKRNAIIATVVSLAAIVVYIAFRFNLIFGVAATIATFHDVLAMVGIFYLLGREVNTLFITAVLTIGGYSLTDTVVVFDRIRENMAKMKSREELGGLINTSINEVLSRTIITSLTTFLAAVALAVFGGKVLFDFGLALIIGILMGTYSSIFIASPLIFLWKGRLR